MVDNISGFTIKKRKLDDDLGQINDSDSKLSHNFIDTTTHKFNPSNKLVNNNNNNTSNKIESNNVQTIDSITSYYQNGEVLSRFLERLKLRTIPLIRPLIDRMIEAENKNVTALKSIDKINKRIKELEFHVEKSIKKTDAVNIGVGADITDSNSEEYRRIMSAIPSSPFAPTKHRSSQMYNPNNYVAKEELNTFLAGITPSNMVPYQQQNGQMIDLTAEELLKSRNQVGVFPQNGITISPNMTPNYYVKNNLHQTSTLSLAQNNEILASIQYLPQANISSHVHPPTLNWKRVKEGICLQWTMEINDPSSNPKSFHIYSFQRIRSVNSNTFPWKMIGQVNALPLPMACTLTQVAKNTTYFFAVRAIIQNDSFSPWSNVVLIEVH